MVALQWKKLFEKLLEEHSDLLKVTEFMEKWLSFIVPVYNVEDYLSECVDSLLNQDVPSELYEIILYDDGSTDGSLRIAQKYGGWLC